MASPEMESIDSRTATLSSEFPELDTRGWTQPSDLPEVVQPNFPEAYGYIRQRHEPGETVPKILAYDQAGKELHSDIVSPLTPEDVYGTPVQHQQLVQPPHEEPASEKPSSADIKHPLRGCTPWRLVLLAVVVILAAVGGGVGGGIAATRAANNAQLVTTSSVITTSIPAATSTTPASDVSTTTTSAPVATQTADDLNNQTMNFAFEAWEKPNYGGNHTDIYKTIGAQAFDFNCTSYIWQPNGTSCCVTFCVDDTWGGWWCQPRQQLNASGPFNNIVIGCENETENNSRKRCVK